MNGTTTSTTDKARRSHATLRRLGAGSVLTVALLAAAASPALAASSGHPSGAAHTSVQRGRGTRIANPVAVKLGPAVSITRTRTIITVVH